MGNQAANSTFPDFLGRLRDGHAWQLSVGGRFLAEGLAVYVPAMSVTASDYSNEVDVYLGNPSIDKSKWKCIEVKSRYLTFSDKGDYPYDSAFVCSLDRWQRRDKKPEWVIVVSTETGRFIGTRKDWIDNCSAIVEITDHKRDYSYKALELPMVYWSDEQDVIKEIRDGIS